MSTTTILALGVLFVGVANLITLAIAVHAHRRIGIVWHALGKLHRWVGKL